MGKPEKLIFLYNPLDPKIRFYKLEDSTISAKIAFGKVIIKLRDITWEDGNLYFDTSCDELDMGSWCDSGIFIKNRKLQFNWRTYDYSKGSYIPYKNLAKIELPCNIKANKTTYKDIIKIVFKSSEFRKCFNDVLNNYANEVMNRIKAFKKHIKTQEDILKILSYESLEYFCK